LTPKYQENMRVNRLTSLVDSARLGIDSLVTFTERGCIKDQLRFTCRLGS